MFVFVYFFNLFGFFFWGGGKTTNVCRLLFHDDTMHVCSSKTRCCYSPFSTEIMFYVLLTLPPPSIKRTTYICLCSLKSNQLAENMVCRVNDVTCMGLYQILLSVEDVKLTESKPTQPCQRDETKYVSKSRTLHVLRENHCSPMTDKTMTQIQTEVFHRLSSRNNIVHFI